MIAGDINHLDAYKKQIPSFLLLCLEAVKDFPFAEKKDGKYDILGCQMSVESPCTEPKEDRKLEGHKKFVDIQFEIKGNEEWIGVHPASGKEEIIEAHEDRDLYFFKSDEKESAIYFTTGRFAIFFPADLHRPLCMGEKGPEKLRKAVVKVPVDRI